MGNNIRASLMIGTALACLTQAAPVTVVTACGTLSAPGIYVLANDLVQPLGNTCLSITGADVTLNMNGHSITGQAGIADDPTIGVHVTAPGTGARIQDGNLTNLGDGSVGILLASVSARVTGMTITGNMTGLFLSNADDNRIDGNTVSNNKRGIEFFLGSDNNTFAGNQCHLNGEACVVLQNSSGNTVIANTIQNTIGIAANEGNGVVVQGGSANEIRNNTITGGTKGVELFSTGTIVRTNTITGAVTGILVTAANSGSTIRNNTVSWSTLSDISDSGSDCDETYSNNIFATYSGLAGCIQ